MDLHDWRVLLPGLSLLDGRQDSLKKSLTTLLSFLYCSLNDPIMLFNLLGGY